MPIAAFELSRRTLARVAGASILAMALLAAFSVAATQSLIVSGDPARTVANLKAHELLFRAGICGWLAISALDVVVALALYGVFRAVNAPLSLLAASFRVVYAAVLLAALGGYFTALRLIGMNARAPEGDALILLSASGFADLWAAGLAVFGIHLGLLGYLAWASDYVPRLLGALVLVAAAAYLVANLGRILLPAYGSTLDLAVAAPAALGELALAVWLLVRAGRIPE